jgi:hypothetical protein
MKNEPSAPTAKPLMPPNNDEVSDGSLPPMTFDLSLSEAAGSRLLLRLVRRC